MTCAHIVGFRREKVEAVAPGLEVIRPHGVDVRHGGNARLRVPCRMDEFRMRDAEGASFEVYGGTARSQAAAMTLTAGQVTGGPDNRHPASDPWLHVVSGSGEAIRRRS